jgi:hypothetical protein
MRALARLAAAVLAAALLVPACATGEAGRASAPAEGEGLQRQVIVQTTIAGWPQGAPGTVAPQPWVSVVVTNAGTGTTAPSSTATQRADNSVPITADLNNAPGAGSRAPASGTAPPRAGTGTPPPETPPAPPAPAPPAPTPPPGDGE